MLRVERTRGRLGLLRRRMGVRSGLFWLDGGLRLSHLFLLEAEIVATPFGITREHLISRLGSEIQVIEHAVLVLNLEPRTMIGV